MNISTIILSYRLIHPINILRRKLHDRKLPSVTKSITYNDALIGVMSPKKEDRHKVDNSKEIDKKEIDKEGIFIDLMFVK